MWTFETESLGRKVIYWKSFEKRKDAWIAAIEWAEIAFENGENVSIKLVEVKES